MMRTTLDNRDGEANSMTLELYFHPLSSFCQKVVVALYETGTPFVPKLVDLGDAAQRATLRQLWPIGKFPVLRDQAADRTIPESSIIIEYLAIHHPGRSQLLPADSEQAWPIRLRDRFYDLSVNVPMQKIITDRLRPKGANDPHGVEEARTLLATAYDMIEGQEAATPSATGERLTMADCAAAPALLYAEMALPFGAGHRNVTAYLDRLKRHPSFARVLEEAQPYMSLVPR